MQELNKPRAWSGKSLHGSWEVTTKIDGVRAIWCGNGGWRSRADKPLYNIPDPMMGDPLDCEVYVGSFRDTIRAVRTQHLKADTPVVKREHLYGLDPLDSRLRNGGMYNPTGDMIEAKMLATIEAGYEGLVLRQGTKWIKVKPNETHDVLVTGFIEGEGRNVGRLGAFKTALGDVGTGISDVERDAFWLAREALLGTTIEVSCMQFTPDGQFRHPAFERLRPDKIATQ